MSTKVFWSPASVNDFEKILAFLKLNWHTEVSTKFIDKVEYDITIIAENPKIFPLINRSLNIRKCVVTKHNNLYYRVNNDNIEIVRLFDSRQDPNNLEF